VPIELVARDKFDSWLAKQPAQTKAMLAFKVGKEGGRDGGGEK
jgi:hypothetical protein